MGQELKSILDNTSYSGEKLFATGGKLTGKLNFQTGAQKGEGLELDVAQQIGDLVKEVAQDTNKSHATDETAAIAKVTAAEADVVTKKAAYDKAPADATIKTAWETALTDNKTAADELDTLYADAKTFESGVINLKVVGAQSAMRAVQELEKAVGTYGEMRSTLGANINRLDSSAANLSNMKDNTELAMSSIVDTDFAVEMTNSSRNQMLMQTSSMMLKQSNGMVNMIGNLLG
ncbi:flagellin [Yersinia frederiksenii]|nr:flagellin [Yersinia frederiksenii]